MAMTAPFIPPRPISAMMTTRPRVSGGSWARASASAATAARVALVTLRADLRDGLVQVPERDVVVLVARQPLVEDRDVDRVAPAGRATPGPPRSAPRPRSSSLDRRVVLGSRPRSAACDRRAGRARRAAGSSCVAATEPAAQPRPGERRGRRSRRARRRAPRAVPRPRPRRVSPASGVPTYGTAASASREHAGSA